MKADLVICGRGPSMATGLEIAHTLSCDLWTLNDKPAPHTTMHWEIHDRALFGPYPAIDAAIATLPAHIPVMSIGTPCPTARNVMRWPHETYAWYYFKRRPIAAGGHVLTHYLANSISYMIAYSVMQGTYQTVYICGVEACPNSRRESPVEHPCIAFYAGWGASKGMRFVIAPSSHLLTTGVNQWRGQYGAEVCPGFLK